MKQIKCWIEAMRLRTLPVSVAGVAMAIGYAILHGQYNLTPAWLCLAFAILAQIASNFANEYYDFKGGLDRKGREGPRRGVTEGDISPRAMKTATFATLALACAIGCSLIFYGGWWLVAVGSLIAIGVIAYSSGPYPLSHHALGEVAVVFFFGIIPVNMTFYLMTGTWDYETLLGSVSAGLLGANVLIVNNYRDHDDDKAVGKNTLAVKFGRNIALYLYLINGCVAVILMRSVWRPAITAIIPCIYLVVHTWIYSQIKRKNGRALNPFLGMTAMAMLLYCLLFMFAKFIS